VIPAPIPADEEHRIAALRSLDLSAAGEERFDRITRLAAAVLDVPVAYISLIDSDQQWFKSCIGLAGDPVDREISFCAHAILQDEPLVVEDARVDPRFEGNPFTIDEPPVVFYVGRPLRDPSTGHNVGSLCCIDHAPRTLTPAEQRLLDDLGRLVEVELQRGEQSRLIGALEDSRRELRLVQRRQEQVLESTEEAILGIDRSGVVAQANAAAARMFRCSVEELVGVDFHERFHHSAEDGTPLAWSACPTNRTLADGRSRRTRDAWFWRADGTGFPAELSTTPIEEDGEVTGAVNVILDMSERRAVERLKQQFVSMVSHELRTPLTSVSGSLRLLAAGLAGELPDEARELVQVAEENAGRLIRLVNDILDLERLRDGRVDIALEPTEVAAVLQSAADTVGGMAMAAGVELEVDADAVAGVRASLDPHRIGQALVNLAGNAVKFSPAGSTVRLVGRVDGDDVLLAVADRGRGIPAEHLETIFEPFSQVDAADDRVHGGSGLGLPIARQLVERQGGTVAVDSEVGVGTTFTIRVPRLEEPS